MPAVLFSICRIPVNTLPIPHNPWPKVERPFTLPFLSFVFFLQYTEIGVRKPWFNLSFVTYYLYDIGFFFKIDFKRNNSIFTGLLYQLNLRKCWVKKLARERHSITTSTLQVTQGPKGAATEKPWFGVRRVASVWRRTACLSSVGFGMREVWSTKNRFWIPNRWEAKGGMERDVIMSQKCGASKDFNGHVISTM